MKRKADGKDFNYFLNLMKQGSGEFISQFTPEDAAILNDVDEDGDNLAHCALVLDQMDSLIHINGINKEAFKLVNKDGYNIAQRAVIHENSANLRFILKECPELIYSTYGKLKYNLIELAHNSKCTLTFNFLSHNYPKLVDQTPHYCDLVEEMKTGNKDGFSDDEDQIDRSIQNAILANRQKNAAAATQTSVNPLAAKKIKMNFGGLSSHNGVYQGSSVILNIPANTPNHNGSVSFNNTAGVTIIANDISRNIRSSIEAAGYNFFNNWLSTAFVACWPHCRGFQLDMDLRFRLEASLSSALIQYSQNPNAKSFDEIAIAFNNTFNSWVVYKQQTVPINTATVKNIAHSILMAIDGKIKANEIGNFDKWLENLLASSYQHYKYSPKLDLDLSCRLTQSLGLALDVYSKSNPQSRNLNGLLVAFSATFHNWVDSKQPQQQPDVNSGNIEQADSWVNRITTNYNSQRNAERN